jgi:hypothetical protein
MKSTRNYLEAIKQKFPRQDIRIEQLYGEDKDFRELCADYLSCVEHLNKYKELKSEKEQAVQDYETALSDLEKELYNFIFP